VSYLNIAVLNFQQRKSSCNDHSDLKKTKGAMLFGSLAEKMLFDPNDRASLSEIIMPNNKMYHRLHS